MGLTHAEEGLNFSLEDAQRAAKPRIVVVGCGGAGCRSVDRLASMGIHGAETLALNTDAEGLAAVHADRKLLLDDGKVRGRGAGGKPAVGRRCAELSEREIRAALAAPDLVFLVAGLGGGTGTGAAPYVAELCEEGGATVTAIATMPFRTERERQAVARRGLLHLKEAANNVVVLENDRLTRLVPDLPILQAFAVMDQLIGEVVKGVTEVVTLPSLINLDFTEVMSFLDEAGTSTVVYGESNDHNPGGVVADALGNPFLDVNAEDARGALVHLTAGTELPLHTTYTVLDGFTRRLPWDADVRLGARLDPEYEGMLRVLGILSGVQGDVVDRLSAESVLDLDKDEVMD